ncbi:hypothetical protein EXS62_01940 [Candidatus Kaiserbacteria bacterium]|nr:hypothetical protein [Candidatus Kaiserbacteria bacterium]
MLHAIGAFFASIGLVVAGWFGHAPAALPGEYSLPTPEQSSVVSEEAPHAVSPTASSTVDVRKSTKQSVAVPPRTTAPSLYDGQIKTPTCSISVLGSPAVLGGKYTLFWSSENADYMTGIATKAHWKPTGSLTVGTISIGKRTYTLTFFGKSGRAVCMITAEILPPPIQQATVAGAPAPTCSLSTDKKDLLLGEPFLLTWTSINARTMKGLEQVGNYALNGSESVTPITAGPRSYALTFVGDGGSVNCIANVTVTAPNSPFADINTTRLSTSNSSPTLTGDAYHLGSARLTLSLSNPSGSVTYLGYPQLSADGGWTLTIDRKLNPGSYAVQVYADEALLTTDVLTILAQ